MVERSPLNDMSPQRCGARIPPRTPDGGWVSNGFRLRISPDFAFSKRGSEFGEWKLEPEAEKEEALLGARGGPEILELDRELEIGPAAEADGTAERPDALVLVGPEAQLDPERRRRQDLLLQLDPGEQRPAEADVLDHRAALVDLLPVQGEDLQLGGQAHLVPDPAAEIAPRVQGGQLRGRHRFNHHVW